MGILAFAIACILPSWGATRAKWRPSPSKSTKAVFLGSVTALVLASLIGVPLGEGTAQLLPTRWTKTIAAGGFLVMSIRLLFFSSVEDCPVQGDAPAIESDL